MLNIILMMFSLKIRTVVFIKHWDETDGAAPRLYRSPGFSVHCRDGETRGIQLVLISDLKA